MIAKIRNQVEPGQPFTPRQPGFGVTVGATKRNRLRHGECGGIARHSRNGFVTLEQKVRPPFGVQPLTSVADDVSEAICVNKGR